MNSVVYCEGAAGAAGATTEAEEEGEVEFVPFPDNEGVGEGGGADVAATAAVGLM